MALTSGSRAPRLIAVWSRMLILPRADGQRRKSASSSPSGQLGAAPSRAREHATEPRIIGEEHCSHLSGGGIEPDQLHDHRLILRQLARFGR